MTSPTPLLIEEPILAEERRDNRIVALLMAVTVAVSLGVLYAH